MPLSEEMAGRLAQRLKDQFGLRQDAEKVAGVWQRALAELGLTDEEAPGRLRDFMASWTSLKNPCLNDFCKYVRRIRPLAPSYRRPYAEQCICGDTGYLSCLVPEREDQHGLMPVSSFEPGEAWGKTAVFVVALPCVCKLGQQLEKREKLNERWTGLRDKWHEYYKANVDDEHGAMHWLNQCQKRSRAAYERHHPVEAPEPAPAPQPNVFERRCELLRRQAAELAASEDVPDGEIPF